MAKTKYYIYSLQDAKGEPPFYIGCTYDIQKRHDVHRRKYVKIRGVEPILRIIRTTYNFEAACEIERQNIEFYSKKSNCKLVNRGNKQGKRPENDRNKRFIVGSLTDYDEYDMLWFTKIGLDKPGLPLICIVSGESEAQSRSNANKMAESLEFFW